MYTQEVDRQEIFESAVELAQELAYWLGTDNAQSIGCELEKTMQLVHASDVKDVVKAFERETYVQTFCESEFSHYAEKLVNFDSAVARIIKENHIPRFLAEVLEDWEGTYEDWYQEAQAEFGDDLEAHL